ncbi:ion channel protein [Streptomyces thermocarboxydovorans]|uniref:Ion channel protein n=1 Tax=Streptomyces thermocarboxydovorans TaxID=59298 RepID=A0ABN1HJK3_9ACTN
MPSWSAYRERVIQHSAQQEPSPAPAAPARALLPTIVPALLVGIVASLVLLGVEAAAEQLEHLLWRDLPDALGVGRYSVLWMFVVLLATAVAVGLVVWKVPGHAGPDPATTGLDAPVLPPAVLPGLVLATGLMLAGGPSLGPENPIIAVNVSLAVWLGMRAFPKAPEKGWVALAEAATIGALFGTPVAAALIISEALAGQRIKGQLWDSLFAPLLAAAAGAITVTLVAQPVFDLGLPAFGHPGWTDLLAAVTVALAGALLGMGAVYAFPHVHGAFRRLRHPMLMLPAGGVVLGALAALGGHLTLFKGLDEMTELGHDPGGWSAGEFAVMAVVKVAAMVVAACCGFRGGRIFPAVFAGTALGLCAHALVPEVHPAVGVAAAVLGMLLAITRQGWLSLFVAAVLVTSPGVITLLVLASLPAWLLVTGRPQMQLGPDARAVR